VVQPVGTALPADDLSELIKNREGLAVFQNAGPRFAEPAGYSDAELRSVLDRDGRNHRRR
jgi:hypothetical protein